MIQHAAPEVISDSAYSYRGDQYAAPEVMQYAAPEVISDSARGPRGDQ